MIKRDILFNSWSGAFFHPGGGEVQLLNSKLQLEQLGYNIRLYNMWSPQKDFDIFHQFSMESGVDHVVTAYKELGKKIAVSTIFWSEPEASSFHFQWIKRILDCADVVLTNSNAESDKLSRHFVVDRSRFFKTRNSVTDTFFTQADPEIFRKKFGINGKFVLSVANIDRRKNTEVLVAACKKLDIPLVSIGAVRDRVYFESFHNNYSGFRVLGPIGDVEMIKSASAACSVFALPSLCETPGIAALEAASQGAPLVITSEGPTEEYFGKYAEYVNPHSVDSVIEGIRSGLSLGVKAGQRDFIKNNYSWRDTAKDIDFAYKKL